MPKEQKMYTKEVKLEAAHLVRAGQKSQAHIARDPDVTDSTLPHWGKELEDHGNNAFPGSGVCCPLPEENRQMKREVELLRQERDKNKARRPCGVSQQR